MQHDSRLRRQCGGRDLECIAPVAAMQFHIGARSGAGEIERIRPSLSANDNVGIFRDRRNSSLVVAVAERHIDLLRGNCFLKKAPDIFLDLDSPVPHVADDNRVVAATRIHGDLPNVFGGRFGKDHLVVAVTRLQSQGLHPLELRDTVRRGHHLPGQVESHKPAGPPGLPGA